jgi:CoA:oxalate CoA-transferase
MGVEQMSVAADGVLGGLRVLEVAHAIAGPHCCQILADHGATVVKIEPLDGERGRKSAPFIGAETAYFPSHNRGKRDIAVDLKSPEGLDILLRLADRADVLVTNYTHGVSDRLGWGQQVLQARNPGLIIVQITGLPVAGGSEFRAYDGAIQSMSGLAALTGEPDGPPQMVGAFIADHVVAHQATTAVLFALEKRRLTGEAPVVSIDMFTSYIQPLAEQASLAGAGLRPRRMANNISTSFGGIFKASDGWVYLCPGNQQMWNAFAHALDRPDWVNVAFADVFGPQRAYYKDLVERWTSQRSRREIVSFLQQHGIPSAPVNEVEEAIELGQSLGADSFIEVVSDSGQSFVVPGPSVRVGLGPAEARVRVPGLSEHAAEILSEIGLPQAEIQRLMAISAVGAPPQKNTAARSDHGRDELG